MRIQDFSIGKTHSFVSVPALLLSGALSIPAWAAQDKVVTFQDGSAELVLHLHYDSLKPGSRTLEYSGDYRAKKGAYRIFAQEDFRVEAGDYKGWAEEHYLENKASADEPPDAVIQEYDFHATLLNAEGDTLYFESGTLTPDWREGLEVFRAYRPEAGAPQEGSIPILAMEGAERDFPDLPQQTSGIRSLGRSLGAMEPPPGATRVEAFDMRGRKIVSEPLRDGVTPKLPAAALFIRFR
jgi:hypothetical protein